jgi:hypothetical protein
MARRRCARPHDEVGCRLRLARMHRVKTPVPGRPTTSVFRGLVLLSLTLAGSACQADTVDDGPDEVVEEFVARMQRVHGDPKAARDAYELLWSDAKRSLAERAKRASAVAGRELAPQAMLAPSRFWLSFLPKRYSAHIDGDWAVVTAIGEEPTQREEVKCVREDGHWRVVLVLPPLPPIQRREEGPDSEHAAPAPK